MDTDPKKPEITLCNLDSTPKRSSFDTDASSRSAREFKTHKEQ
jgi:hypothetical protein